VRSRGCSPKRFGGPGSPSTEPSRCGSTGNARKSPFGSGTRDTRTFDERSGANRLPGWPASGANSLAVTTTSSPNTWTSCSSSASARPGAASGGTSSGRSGRSWTRNFTGSCESRRKPLRNSPWLSSCWSPPRTQKPRSSRRRTTSGFVGRKRVPRRARSRRWRLWKANVRV